MRADTALRPWSRARTSSWTATAVVLDLLLATSSAVADDLVCDGHTIQLFRVEGSCSQRFRRGACDHLRIEGGASLAAQYRCMPTRPPMEISCGAGDDEPHGRHAMEVTLTLNDFKPETHCASPRRPPAPPERPASAAVSPRDSISRGYMATALCEDPPGIVGRCPPPEASPPPLVPGRARWVLTVGAGAAVRWELTDEAAAYAGADLGVVWSPSRTARWGLALQARYSGVVSRGYFARRQAADVHLVEGAAGVEGILGAAVGVWFARGMLHGGSGWIEVDADGGRWRGFLGASASVGVRGLVGPLGARLDLGYWLFPDARCDQADDGCGSPTTARNPNVPPHDVHVPWVSIALEGSYEL